MKATQYRAPKQPLKWHGGKQKLAKELIALMPPHLHYVEPYAGGLAVLLDRDPNRDWMGIGNGVPLPSSFQGCSEVINDLHGELMNFWAVLQHPDLFGRFQRVVEAVPFSEEQWKLAAASSQGDDAVLRAVGFFIRCRQSRAGTFKEFSTVTRNRTRRGMNGETSAWLTAISGLPEVHSRLKRVVILNRDALDVIKQQDGEKTLFYIDPPYVEVTRVTTNMYLHEMSDEDHKKLLEVLAECKGKFLLSGYPSKLYDDFAAANNWQHVDFDVPNHAAGGDHKRRMIERVWINYENPCHGKV